MATLQSLSGTGSLRVAAEFLAKFLPGKTAYLSNPTWGNHKVRAPAFRLSLVAHGCCLTCLARPSFSCAVHGTSLHVLGLGKTAQWLMLPGDPQNIFADAGVEWKWYRYFEPKTVGLDFEGMMEDLRGAPEGSVVILHGQDTSFCLSVPTPPLHRLHCRSALSSHLFVPFLRR